MLLSTGCGSSGFNPASAIQSAPVHLDAEYVMLTPEQVRCGVQHDLWDPPVDAGSRSTARLTQKARDLKFSDDVSIGDMQRPYAQIRGEFTLTPLGIESDREGPEKETRQVEAKLGVAIPDSCFAGPLPLMGVRKGDFTQDSAPLVLLRNDNGWRVDRIVH